MLTCATTVASRGITFTASSPSFATSLERQKIAMVRTQSVEPLQRERAPRGSRVGHGSRERPVPRVRHIELREQRGDLFRIAAGCAHDLLDRRVRDLVRSHERIDRASRGSSFIVSRADEANEPRDATNPDDVAVLRHASHGAPKAVGLGPAGGHRRRPPAERYLPRCAPILLEHPMRGIVLAISIGSPSAESGASSRVRRVRHERARSSSGAARGP